MREKNLLIWQLKLNKLHGNNFRSKNEFGQMGLDFWSTFGLMTLSIEEASILPTIVSSHLSHVAESRPLEGEEDADDVFLTKISSTLFKRESSKIWKILFLFPSYHLLISLLKINLSDIFSDFRVSFTNCFLVNIY